MTGSACDVCGKPAKYHETALQEGQVVEAHFCGAHGQTLWFPVLRSMLISQIDGLPDELLPADTHRDQLKIRLAAAQSLNDVRTAFHP